MSEKTTSSAMTTSTPATSARRIVVMGVAGCGKSTLGARLAEALALPFTEGDDLHSSESRAKMAAGIPLEDADRWPWLDRVGEALGRQEEVIARSALKRVYRDRIRARAGRFSLCISRCQKARSPRGSRRGGGTISTQPFKRASMRFSSRWRPMSWALDSTPPVLSKRCFGGSWSGSVRA